MADIEVDVEVNGTEEGARGVQNLTESFADFKTGLVGVGGVVAAVGAGVAALRAFAMEADRQQGILSHFTGDTRAATAAMGGMVTQLQMVEAHNRLAAAGINLSGRDLRNVLVAAFQQAEATGSEFNATLDQLGQAIVRGGRGLRQFGIEAQGPQQALEELNTKFGEMEVSADSLGDRFEQIDTTISEMSASFMDAVSDTGALETAFTALFDVVGQGDLSFEQAMSNMVDSAEFMGLLVGRHINAIAELVRSHSEGWRALMEGDWRAASAAFARGNAVVGDVVTGRTARQALGELGDRQFERDQRGFGQPAAPTRITGGGRRAANDNGDDRFSAESMDESARREAEFAQELFDQGMDERRERWEEEAEIRREMHDEELALVDEQKEKAREEHELRLEMLDEEKRKAREATEQVREDAMGVLQPVVKGLTNAIKDVITGAKSADEAFQGLLSSFLEMIAQEAALSAAKEFASAIASFASQDYPGGALHLAAGAAWTGVAIAAGAASVAVAPSVAAPASPESGSESSGGGSQTTVINWNSPVVAATTYADLGQQMGEMISAGQRRYGRAA